MERNALGEIDHDAHDGPIGGWTDQHGRDAFKPDGARTAHVVMFAQSVMVRAGRAGEVEGAWDWPGCQSWETQPTPRQ